MKILSLISLFLVTILSGSAGAQITSEKHHSQTSINCIECHICKNPTFKKPCLKICPDFKRAGKSLEFSVDDAPEFITIDTLSRRYGASLFSHKLHAEMAIMSGGCSICHHHNPPGKILACSECHETSKKRQDISKPSLSGAYHQLCLDCHRQWSHQTNCTVCHEEKGRDKASAKKELVEKTHAKIKLPLKRIYQTEYEEGQVVTFFHEAHSKNYGLKCEDCHKDESCAHCHDSKGKFKAPEKEAHENCINCHEKDIDDNCTKCHDTKERNAFDHARVGWKLNKHHASLSCKSCHKGGKFTKLSKNCLSCHKNFKPGKFDHKVTGLILDENHIENDCSDCHIDNNFAKKPVCSECHDGYSYPARKPGRRTSG